MTGQTKAVIVLILATAATALANEFDELVKAAENVKSAKQLRRCPFGWVEYQRRCFTYQSSRVDWVSAERHCQRFGAHLVSIHSDKENLLVKALIRAHDHQENPTWIGLSGCQKAYNFFWSDGTRLDFTKWNPREPNHTAGECCVHINWSNYKNWKDIPCQKQYAFVCAKNVR